MKSLNILNLLNGLIKTQSPSEKDIIYDFIKNNTTYIRKYKDINEINTFLLTSIQFLDLYVIKFIKIQKNMK